MGRRGVAAILLPLAAASCQTGEPRTEGTSAGDAASALRAQFAECSAEASGRYSPVAATFTELESLIWQDCGEPAMAVLVAADFPWEAVMLIQSAWRRDLRQALAAAASY